MRGHGAVALRMLAKTKLRTLTLRLAKVHFRRFAPDVCLSNTWATETSVEQPEMRERN